MWAPFYNSNFLVTATNSADHFNASKPSDTTPYLADVQSMFHKYSVKVFEAFVGGLCHELGFKRHTDFYGYVGQAILV
jgi:hypothetical protein